jgi:hypothetical protein
MGDGWYSILSGGAIAIFAFVLAVGWDVLRARRERTQRDRALLTAALAETEATIATASNDLGLVQRELGLLAKDQRLLNPLDPIEGGFWDAIKLDPPAALFEEADTLARIRDVSRRTDQTR